jgi:hypothetical protein
VFPAVEILSGALAMRSTSHSPGSLLMATEGATITATAGTISATGSSRLVPHNLPVPDQATTRGLCSDCAAEWRRG